jgi:hypothetical protein
MRNIAQPCAICQQNLLFALDKEFLTARTRLGFAFGATRNAHSRNKFARRAQIEKFKIRHDDQLVMQKQILARVATRKQLRMKIQMQTKCARMHA